MEADRELIRKAIAHLQAVLDAYVTDVVITKTEDTSSTRYVVDVQYEN